jgi:hypothetical protein
MLKSFLQYINETMDHKTEFIKGLSQNLIERLRTSPFDESTEYSVFSGMSFIEPFNFNLILNVRRDTDLSTHSDSHFNSLPWEKINFDNLGYAIDANTKMSKSKLKIPSITIHIVLNPKLEPLLYSKLFFRLIDILAHETNHLDQLGLNRDPFNVNVSSNHDRDSAKKSYRYFLLPEEIESMVEGMYTRSKVQNINLDKIFDDYLLPFIESEYINKSEYLKVMQVWIFHALEVYPDCKFSNKVKSIIDSI